MTEEEARGWLSGSLGVSTLEMEQLERFSALLLEANGQQNLIARSTGEQIWSRHIVDSAQLLQFSGTARPNSGPWLDLGSGPGLPGLVVAILSGWSVHLVENRARRIAFLNEAVEHLGLQAQVTVDGRYLERVESFPAAVISARAFAPLDRLLELAHRFSDENTLWLLPKGRNAATEMEAAAGDWRMMFHVEHSLTDADAGILVGSLKGRRR